MTFSCVTGSRVHDRECSRLSSLTFSWPHYFAQLMHLGRAPSCAGNTVLFQRTGGRKGKTSFSFSIVTRTDTLKSGQTPHVYYTTLNPRREPFMPIYCADFWAKWGYQSKKQLCKENCSIQGLALKYSDQEKSLAFNCLLFPLPHPRTKFKHFKRLFQSFWPVTASTVRGWGG